MNNFWKGFEKKAAIISKLSLHKIISGEKRKEKGIRTKRHKGTKK